MINGCIAAHAEMWVSSIFLACITVHTMARIIIPITLILILSLGYHKIQPKKDVLLLVVPFSRISWENMGLLSWPVTKPNKDTSTIWLYLFDRGPLPPFPFSDFSNNVVIEVGG